MALCSTVPKVFNRTKNGRAIQAFLCYRPAGFPVAFNVGASMTIPPGMPDNERPRRNRRVLVYAGVAILILLMIALGVGLKVSLHARRALCPPSNPNCGPLPPTAPPAQLPGSPPPR